MHFDIYDLDGVGKVDASLLGDLIRSLDLRPTQAAITKAGGTNKKGQKLLTIEEFLPIYSQIKKDKDCGAFEDLLEGLKLYDKQENGTMMAAELAHVMLSLGMFLLSLRFHFLCNSCLQMFVIIQPRKILISCLGSNSESK